MSDVKRPYAVNSRVRFRSSANKEITFTGTITGYDEKRDYAFIRDDGRERPRPVAVKRIIGYAMGGHVPQLVA